jgi:EmrB/QacA subfamily drug resistance transporter
MSTTTATGGKSLSHQQILVVFSGLMLGMLLAALDQTIVATALPTIVGELGGLDHLSWVVTAYLLTSTASTPLYGKISDLYGRKIVFQAAIVIFLAGSVLAGLAQNMAQLIGFRAIQGLGAGGLIAMALAIIGDVVSPRERGRYQGYMGSVFALASVAGPLLGGLFVEHLSWRWVFYINLPVGAVALVVTSVVLDLPFARREHAIDYLGAALLVAAVTCTLLATVWGGTEYAWSSPVILGLIAAAVALTVLFVLQERRAPEPILPLRLFRNSVFSVSSAVGFLVGLTMFGAIVFLPLFLQVVNGVSPTRSGLLILPLMLGLIGAAVASGRTITRIGRYKVFPVVGTAVMTVGVYLFTHLDQHTAGVLTSLYMVVLGAGIGMVFQVLVLAVQNAVEHRDLGTATSVSTFFRSMGGAFGTAIFGAIFGSQLARHLSVFVPGLGGSLTPDSLQGSPEQISSLPPAILGGVIEAFARSVHSVFVWTLPFAVLAFALSLLLKEIPLKESAHVGWESGEVVGPPDPSVRQRGAPRSEAPVHRFETAPHGEHKLVGAQSGDYLTSDGEPLGRQARWYGQGGEPGQVDRFGEPGQPPFS